MSDLELRIREVGPWFHNIELAPGVETRKIDPAPGPQPLDHPLKRWKKIEPYLPDIDPSLGRFDLVLMLAVFYHLVDPVLALVNLGRISDSVYVETIATDDDENSTMRWGLSMGFDGFDGWIPTTRCVRDLLKYAGFDEVTQIASAADNRPMFYARRSTSL